jgi:hypothetical protein
VLGLLLGLAGCGGRSGLEVPDVDAGPDVVDPGDTAVPSPDAPACVPKCATDLECQLSCPAVGSGESECCDPGAHICYKFAGATCPSPLPDGGPTPPPY